MSICIHDDKWTLRNMCLACVISRVEDEEELNLRKRQLLRDLLEALRGTLKREVLRIFADECQMTLLFLDMLLEITDGEDEPLSQLAVECIVYLLLGLQSRDFELHVLQKITENMQESTSWYSRPASLQLLNQILQTSSSVLEAVSSSVPLQHLFITALEESSKPVQAVMVDVLHFLYSSVPSLLDCPSLQHLLPRAIIPLLSSSKSSELQLKSISLLQVLLKNEVLIHKLLRMEVDNVTFPSILKKLILVRDGSLQTAAVSSILQIITFPHQADAYAIVLMDNDVVEFLYETLASSNEKLLLLVLTCVTAFSRQDVFFTGNHAIYGIEAVARSTRYLLEVNNTEVAKKGLLLLYIILEGHQETSWKTGSRMSNEVLYNQLSEIVKTSFECSSLVTCSVRLLAALLRRRYLPHPVPFTSVLEKVERCKELLRKVLKPGNDTADHLVAGLRVVVSCFSLVKDCMGDPTSQEETYSCPNDSGVARMHQQPICQLDDLTESSLSLLDELIPFAVVVKGQVARSEVHEVLLQSLCAAYDMDLTDGRGQLMVNFSRKLLACRFLDFTMNGSIPGKDNNQQAKFLQLFLVHMLHQEPEAIPSVYQEIVFDGCASLAYSSDEELLFGASKSSHFCWLFLHYVRCRYGSGDVSAISSAFLSYLVTNRLTIETPAFHLKICLFIFAVVSFEVEEEDRNLAQCNEETLRLLSDLSNLSVIYCHHPLFLKWCLSTSDHVDVLGSFAISEWIRQAADITDHQILLKELDSNELSAQCFWETFDSGITERIKFLELALKNGLLLDDEYCEIAKQVRLFLPEILLRLLLNQSGQEEFDSSISSLMKLICGTRERGAFSEFSLEHELKITFQLCSLLSKRNALQKNAVREILMYLAYSLKMGLLAEPTDGRGAAVIVNNVEILGIIRETVTASDSELLLCVLSLLLQLVYCCDKLDIRFQHKPIVLEWSEINKWLNMQESKEQVVALKLLEASLSARCSVDSALVRIPQPERGTRLDDCSREILTAFIIILNILSKQNAMTDDAATMCTLALVEFSKPNSTLESHLVCSPWWRIVFSTRKGDENTDKLQSFITKYLE